MKKTQYKWNEVPTVLKIISWGYISYGNLLHLSRLLFVEEC